MGALKLAYTENYTPLKVAYSKAFESLKPVQSYLSVDPHASTYADVSPYAFSLNTPIWAKDDDGRDVIILSAPKGAGGFGHAAVLIGNDKDGWKLYSKNGTYGSGSSKEKSSGPSNKNPQVGVHFNTLKEFANSESNFDDNEEIEYKSAFRITTDKETDTKMKEAAAASVKADYNVLEKSCIDVPSDALTAGGLDPGYTTDEVPVGVEGTIETKSLSAIPNTRYKEIVANNVGKDVTKDIVPDAKVVGEHKKVGDEKKATANKAAADKQAKFIDSGPKN